MSFLYKLTDFLVLFIACIGIVLASIYFFFYCKVKEIHKSPGDIYFGMCFGEIIFVIHAAIFSVINLEKNPPEKIEALCYINLIAFTFAVILIYAYTIQQYLFMIFKLLYSLQTQKLKNWLSHALTWIFALLYSGTSILTYDLYGCGKGSLTQKAPFTFIILLFSFYAMGITTRLYIRDQVNQYSEAIAKLHGQDFQGYIKRLFNGQAWLMSLFILFSMIVFLLKENEYKNNYQKTFPYAIEIFTCLGELSAVLYPVVIPILRFTDPFLLKHLKEYYYNLPGETPQIQEQELGPMRSPSLDLNLISFLQKKGENTQSVISELLDIEQQQEEEPEKLEQNTQSQDDLINPFIEQFQISRRSEIIQKMIAFILLSERQKLNPSKLDMDIQEQQADNDFKKFSVYTVQQKIFQQEFKKEFDNKVNKQYQTKALTMTSYAPEVFQILIKNDLDKLNILECLDMKKNERELKKCAQGKGGKSGEFFFFNYNNRLLLKTVTLEELDTLKKMLESYFWHCAENPNTALAKILGIYTFEGFDIGRTTLIIMKNIAKINKKAKVRVYDLKGSTYDRRVCKNYYKKEIQVPNGQIIETKKEKILKYDDTLKDLDFKEIDDTLKVSCDNRFKIFSQLFNDTQYLKSQGFMDYSLCIIVVDWMGFLKSQQPDLKEELLKEFMLDQVKSRQHCYKNEEIEGEYYHLGIIDYLQTYNLSKMSEKYAKKLIKFDLSLDTSSQSPQEYRTRFLNYMRKILDLIPKTESQP